MQHSHTIFLWPWRQHLSWVFQRVLVSESYLWRSYRFRSTAFMGTKRTVVVTYRTYLAFRIRFTFRIEACLSNSRHAIRITAQIVRVLPWKCLFRFLETHCFGVKPQKLFFPFLIDFRRPRCDFFRTKLGCIISDRVFFTKIYFFTKTTHVYLIQIRAEFDISPFVYCTRALPLIAFVGDFVSRIIGILFFKLPFGKIAFIIIILKMRNCLAFPFRVTLLKNLVLLAVSCEIVIRRQQ